MSARFFDSHCHLDVRAFQDDAGVDAAVQRALDAGVERMVCIGAGYGHETAARAVAVAERHDAVWASVGLHPHDARLWSDESWAGVRALADHPKVVAMGEMGLDFYYDSSPRDEQRRVLRLQAREALALDLPIVVHDRDSDGEVLAILTEEGAFHGAGVVWHCYTGGVELMEAIVDRGGYISIPGIVTFKNAGGMREVAAATPLERLLIETDSPFLTPTPHRGKRNEPAYVAHVGEAVAVLRGMTTEELASATWDNASRFYGID